MKQLILLKAALLLCLIHLYSQSPLPRINSGELISRAVILHDSGQFKQAIALYDQVSRNDSNYVRALYEKAVSLGSDSQYAACIQTCRLAQAEARGLSTQLPDIYNQLGNTLDWTGQRELALATFDTAIGRYPAYSLLSFNKGVIYFENQQWDSAEALFKKTLLINPYQFSAHYDYAMSCLQQGKLIPAMLGLIGYLNMYPSGRYSRRCINLLAEISNARDDVMELKNKRKQEPPENYQQLEEIILSKIALDKQYKPLLKLDDAISRQIQVLFEKMEFNETDGDFALQYYVPYFHKIFADGKFELFINHIFSDVNLPEIIEYNKKHKKETEAFISEAAGYFNEIKYTRELFFAKRAAVEKRYIYEDGQLIGKGQTLDKGEKLVGAWEFYFPAGNLKSRGQYDAEGKRSGEWNYFYFDGRLRAVENFVKGELTGKSVFYSHNGLVSGEKNYLNGKEEGPMNDYYPNGQLQTLSIYKNGKLEGEKKDYYVHGALHYLTSYVAGIKEGAYKEFFPDGRPQGEYHFSNDLLEGPFKTYEQNGQVSEEGQLKAGKPEGEWKLYYPDGKLKTREFFAGGQLEGAFEEFNDNGSPLSHYTFKKGKAFGEVSLLDPQGKRYRLMVYDNDILQSNKAFDSTGKLIYAAEKKGKTFSTDFYSAGRFRERSLTFDEKGRKTGLLTDYYPSGKTAAQSSYDQDAQNGPYTSFFANGKIKTEVPLADGKKDGLYREYFASGQLKEQGWYDQDEAVDEWRTYDETGTLTDKTFYSGGEITGYREFFWGNGTLNMVEHYDQGWLDSRAQYDSAGRWLRSDSFPQGSGPHILFGPDGTKAVVGTYVHGLLEGPEKVYYFDGSLHTESVFKNGLMTGHQVNYWYGGKKQSEGDYAHNKRTGLWKFYTNTGLLESTSQYENGKLEGPETEYFENGHPETEFSYKNDEREGPTRKYDPSGSLAYQTNYHQDELVSYSWQDAGGKLLPAVPMPAAGGKLRTFFANGKPSREMELVDGRLNGNDIIYFENGKLGYLCHYVLGLREGDWKEYYPDGTLKLEGHFEHDGLVGPYQLYYPSGKLKESAQYRKGENHGPLLHYDESGKLLQVQQYYYGFLVGAKNN